MECRFCKTELTNTFIDLVNSPASNSFLTKAQLNEPETFYPLKVYTCNTCFLVQVDEYKKSDKIFDNKYVYFSSYSTSWLKHAKAYTEMMTERFNLGPQSRVVELASNDGYLLQYFKENNIPEKQAACRKIILEQYPLFCDLLHTKPLCKVSEEFLGQMCSIPITPKNPLQLKETLYNKYKIEIPVMQRGSDIYLRISYHVYNTPEDLEYLKQTIQQPDLGLL